MKMKKVLSIFLSILLLTSFMLMSVFAEETLDGFEYEENSAENTVTITGYSGAEMEIQIPGTINGKPVTRIGANAFKGSGLSSIEIPASVTSIGSYAFSSCTNLNSVTFEEGSQLARIESSVFRESGLTSIKIPASVTSIGSRAFYSCTNLSSVTFEEGSQLDSIVSRAFEESGLTSIKIPASVTSVETMAFNNCNDLKSITFQGETAPNIDNATFSGCNNLAAIYVSVSCIAADSYKEGNWSGLWNQGKIQTQHVLSNVKAKEASCTEDGNKEYWKCANCSKYFSDKDGKTEISENSTVIEKTGHSMTHVEAKKASCTEDGNKEYWHCAKCDGYFFDNKGEDKTSQKETVIEKTGHNMTHVEAKEASCTEDGNKEYWKCANCDSYFLDKDGQNRTTKEETEIAKTGHSMTHVEAKKASCTEDGNKEYWHCAKCDGYFFDNKGEDKTSQKETVIEKTGHNMTHVEAKKVSCTEDGNKEYWHCAKCDGYFFDNKGEDKTSQKETVIEKTGHSMTHVEAKKASCTEDGNKEYWYCVNCGIYYADKDGQKKISKDETVIAKTGHSIKHVEAAEAGFMEAGNIEYWYCPKCDTYFSDENLTVIISKEQTIVPPIGNTTDSELPKPEENPKQSTDLPQEDLDDTKDAGGEMIDNAKTGDDLDIGPWITVMLSAGLALSVAAVYRKKKN